MVAASNFIRCRFCDWSTRKWGRGSNPGKAFARLAEHLAEEHEDRHTEIFLASEKLNERNDEYEHSLQNEA